MKITESEPSAVQQAEPSITELCDLVRARLPAITDHVVRRIRREIPHYAEHVPVEDLRAAALEHLGMLLHAIAEQRSASAEEVAARAPLGRRRAAQGVTADGVLRAFTIGYRELWRELAEEAARHPDERMAAALLPALDTGFGWVQDATAAIVAAHHATAAAQHSIAVANRQRLIELLAAGDPDAPDCHAAALALDLDVEGPFHALWFADPSADPARLHAVDVALSAVAGRCITGRYGHGVVVLTQDAAVTQIGAAVHRAVDGANLGIGLQRHGLRGAQLSIVDAALAGTLATRLGGDRDFADSWLLALVVEAEERLGPLLADAVAVTRANPHLADAVAAFAAKGFAVAAAARALHVHPNTLTYRLERWRVLTGLDARTWTGLQRGLLAVELGRLPAARR